MGKITQLKQFIVIGLTGLVIGTAPLALAAAPIVDPVSPACDQLSAAQQAESPTCNSRTKDNPLIGPNGTLKKVADIIAIIAGIAAVIMVMVGGFKMITASGDAQAVAGARKTVIGALIGLVVIVLARSIVLFVLGRL